MSADSGSALRDAVWPTDPAYERSRRIWNGMIDRRPAVIARCATATDVSAAVRYAAEAGLAVSVRGGGHNVAGLALVDGALLIDLSPMRAVHVDADRAVATAGGGALLADLDAATIPYGLACPVGVVSETGLGGLALGGGYGWLARKWGLTCDHLLAAEVVLADGTIVEASDDLLWGLRGGGGNYGVVTRFTLRLRPVGDVGWSTAVYPAPDALAALDAYRHACPEQPDDLQIVAAFKHAPAVDWLPAALHGTPVLAVTAVWLGDADGAEHAARTALAAVPPAGHRTRIMPYAQLQALGDGSEPAGRRYSTNSCYLADLPAAAAETLLRHATDGMARLSTIDLGYFLGAVARVDDDATAFPSRRAPYICSASAAWEDPAEDAANRAWSRSLVGDLRPWHYGGSYSNYTEATPHSAMQVYGDARYARMAALKATVDPVNVFAANHNIRPAVWSG